MANTPPNGPKGPTPPRPAGAPGTPPANPNANPNEPSSLIPPEETIWRKYSSHYEFPLSVMSSVVLHCLAVLTIAFFGSLLFDWGNGDPPEVENVEFAGGGGDPNGRPGDANEGPEAASAAETSDDLKFDPDQLRVDDREGRTMPDALSELPKTDLQPTKRDFGKGGSGSGGGLGSGIGTGEGPGAGPGKAGRRALRTDRWGIRFDWTNGDQVLAFWGGLGSYLIVDNFEQGFLYYKDLNTKQGTVIKQEEFNKVNKRVWFMLKASDQNTPCPAVAQTLGLKKVPRFVAFLIPKELEDQLLEKELAYQKKDEKFLDQHRFFTTFDVTRAGDKFNVKVVSQVAEKKR